MSGKTLKPDSGSAAARASSALESILNGGWRAQGYAEASARRCFRKRKRSKQPSAFSVLRALLDEFSSSYRVAAALAGAFGYDLLFQFDPIELKLPRNDVKDLRLFFCDDIYFMDRKKSRSSASSTIFHAAAFRHTPWRAPPTTCLVRSE